MKIEQEWRPVVGYEGLYGVSNYGEVRKTDGTPMKGNINSYGYRVVGLTKNGRRKDKKVHQLVALAFLPTIPGKDYVNHKDGDKLNNFVDNLEWVTKGENSRHAATILGISTSPRPVWQLSLDDEPQVLYLNTTLAENAVNGNHMMIAACCKGTAQTAYGHKWEYADGEMVRQIARERTTEAVMARIAKLREEIDALEASI